MLPSNLGELRSSDFGSDAYRTRTIKDEMRANLICKLQAKEPLFSGIVGYEETVIPQVVNAILSRHNMILLGLRGQAKSRILRDLVDFSTNVFLWLQAVRSMIARSRPSVGAAAISFRTRVNARLSPI